MKIKNTFHLTLLLGALVILLATGTFAYLQWQITTAVQQKEMLDRFSNDGMELVQLSNEVLLYEEPRAIQQWQVLFDQVQADSRQINGLKNTHAGGILGRAVLVLDDMPALLNRVVADRVPHSRHSVEQRGRPEAEDLLASQFFRKTVQFQTQVRELIQVSEAELKGSVASTKSLMLTTFAIFTGLIAILTLVASYLFRRMILQPVQHLDDVIDKIKDGNLDQRAKVFADDELGVVCETLNGLLDQQEVQRRELQLAADQLRATFEQAAVGIAHIDTAGACLLANRRLGEMLGVPPEQLLGNRLDRMTAPEYRACDAASRQALLAGEIDTYAVEKCFTHLNGERVWTNLTVSFVREENGPPPYFVVIVEDISSRKTAEQRVEFLAFHDVLTGLPNQLLAQDRLAHGVAFADRAHGKLAFLFLDLDNFKTINDSLGHVVGDHLLKAVAERLIGCVRDIDTVCRKGGDEFVIILASVLNADDIAAVADKLLSRLATPFHIDGHELSTSVSIGIAIYPDDGREFDVLLTKSDTAMYQAKAAGRDAYRFFTDQMNTEASEYLRIRNGLTRALEQGEFVLYYQPQVDLASGTIIGAEALIRWSLPEGGMMPPNRFIPVAEDSGLILLIGTWVIREACRQIAAWRAAGLPPVVVAVNLSGVQFKRGDLESTVLLALEENGVPANMLELELTESILISDTESVLATVRKLKSHGLNLSIDDFGTGYSSLAYLRRFHVDKLKIDQSFVRGLAKDPEDVAIVQTIINLAQSLHLRTVAEGVEDVEAADMLLRFGCDEAQGFHFARPMPAAEFATFLAAGHARAVLPEPTFSAKNSA